MNKSIKPPITKEEALEKYRAALDLKISTPIFEWLGVFSDAADLRDFWEDTKDFSWPSTFGSPPWRSIVSTLAYRASEGISAYALSSIRKDLASEGRSVVADARREVFLMRQYGLIGRDTERQLWRPTEFLD